MPGRDLGGAALHGEARGDLSAVAGGRFDLERTGQQLDALAHAPEPESHGVDGWVESVAVVADAQLHRRCGLAGFDQRPFRLAVL